MALVAPGPKFSHPKGRALGNPDPATSKGLSAFISSAGKLQTPPLSSYFVTTSPPGSRVATSKDYTELSTQPPGSPLLLDAHQCEQMHAVIIRRFSQTFLFRCWLVDLPRLLCTGPQQGTRGLLQPHRPMTGFCSGFPLTEERKKQRFGICLS